MTSDETADTLLVCLRQIRAQAEEISGASGITCMF